MKKLGPPFRSALVAAALASLVAACEPEPHFATPEGPLPGKIVTEASLVADGSDQQLGLLYRSDLDPYQGGYRIKVTVPQGAYPVGTRVTVRLLYQIETQGRYIGLEPFSWTSATALQILPAGRDPERPLHIEFVESRIGNTSYLLLHAREAASDWSVVSGLDGSYLNTSFEATRSGLWSSTRNVSTGALFKRVGLTCDGRSVSNPHPVLLDLIDGVYSATTINNQGCHVTQTAPMLIRGSQICFELTSEACTERTESEMSLTWKGGNSECGTASAVTERYQALTEDSPEVLPTEPASCQTKEGGQADGGRD